MTADSSILRLLLLAALALAGCQPETGNPNSADDDDATADDDDSSDDGYEIYEATVSSEFTEECGADFWTLDPVHEFTTLNLEIDYKAASELGHNTGFRIWSSEGFGSVVDTYGNGSLRVVPDFSDGSVVVGLLQEECVGGAEAHVVGAAADGQPGGTLGATVWSCANCDCVGFTWLFLHVPGEALNYEWAECQGSWHQ